MNESRLEQVLVRLGSDLPILSKRVTDVVREGREPDGEAGDEALFVSVHRTLVMVFRALRQGHSYLDAEGLDLVSQIIQQRYRDAVPTEDAVREFAQCVGHVNQHFLRVCADLGADGDDAMHGSDCLWRLGDAISERVVKLYDDLNRQQAQLDTQQRTLLVRRLVTGRAAPSELRSLPLDVDADYAAIRVLARPGASLSVQNLESSGGMPMRRGFLAAVNGECIGVVAKAPQVGDGAVAGMGPLRPLSDVAQSFTIADRVAHLASYRGLAGVHTLGELGWQVAAVAQPEVNRTLRHRFLDPLRGRGAFGADLEVTVRNYLAHHCNYTDAARELNLHVNTLRYRLRRFSDITNADLDDPVDLVNVVWAFELGDMPVWQPCLQRGSGSARQYEESAELRTAPVEAFAAARSMSALSV
ncbi:helix-turn-helix domain-containing protein [Propionimicrobium sp. PCR01-08-3]|uniref:PucR family transcriptional regulator n=1 Tax=Propionimicrobium sp. PCR01-08-3 TaxID=3052086 RepID=UPI00255D00B0|nr:helix-turn-helix domain-containing protein [Propionimicrobium sp. PCR01-08-3]WIY81563.1 helix-turn-helix domain-containing protein [Propionimicrobium sp. PCR01-08-3]